MATSQLIGDAEGGQRFCKQDEALPLKEEQYISPESCQQLEPEILNCAVELSFYNTLIHTRDDDEEDDIFFDNKDVNVDHSSKDLKVSNSASKEAQPRRQHTDLTDDKLESEMEHVTRDCMTEEIKNKSDLLQVLPDSSSTTKPTTEADGRESSLTEMGIDPTLDIEEDLYQSIEEIEEEKTNKIPIIYDKISKEDRKVGVEPEMDIVEYCSREWRGKTNAAKVMKKGYEEVAHHFCSIRRVRGDNYCALRATLFQVLRQTTELPPFLNDEALTQLPENFVEKYDWIKQWRLWHAHESKKVWMRLKDYLELLKKKWVELSEMKIPAEKQKACDEIFKNEDEEYCLYEAVKFLMLKTAIDLYNANVEGREVPVFSWLLFARNNSNDPCEFMKNHLNKVGHTGGLEQVEMFLLGYALQHTIKVYRLYKYGTDEFVTHYPDDKPDWPAVTLITEDDRHYNVPTGEFEETSL
ncbi:ubiquitin thioesterase otulin isoform X2 [Pelobates cultripes]|uniref:Ubiquitin thioesterase otulin isoform X2 n=1 Tax=Pelobates cultripes TaxID=61616 RepID=A0AAD1RYY1_PELCU|nr:ubiquitin thioesterase otulin isoform X2 [Pelobates cultripes]